MSDDENNREPDESLEDPVGFEDGGRDSPAPADEPLGWLGDDEPDVLGSRDARGAPDDRDSHDATQDRDGGIGREEPSIPDPSDPAGEADRRGDPFESGDSVFQRQDVDEIDPDAVWERLAQLDGVSVTDDGDSTYAEVSKHSYCEQCEYFTEPPEVACAHGDAEIVEFLDMETVRLLNCPIVEERRAIRNED